MFLAEVPPVVVAVPADKPVGPAIVSRETHSDVVAGKDTPLPLFKARKTEDAILRQTIFVTTTLTVVRPKADADERVLQWTYEPYLQRQLCFTSMIGVFSCAQADIEDLREKAEGQAPLAQTPPDQARPGPNPAAEAARTGLTTALRARADALFEDDRRLKIGPVLKAAGVSVRRVAVSTGRERR